MEVLFDHRHLISLSSALGTRTGIDVSRFKGCEGGNGEAACHGNTDGGVVSICALRSSFRFGSSQGCPQVKVKVRPASFAFPLTLRQQANYLINLFRCLCALWLGHVLFLLWLLQSRYACFFRGHKVHRICSSDVIFKPPRDAPDLPLFADSAVQESVFCPSKRLLGPLHHSPSRP